MEAITKTTILTFTVVAAILLAIVLGCALLWQRRWYWLLAVYLLSAIAVWRWRSGAAAIAATIILAVALSRLYLGAHYLSDVLGAMAAGLGWAALCFTKVETWCSRRGLTSAQAGPPVLQS